MSGLLRSVMLLGAVGLLVGCAGAPDAPQALASARSSYRALSADTAVAAAAAKDVARAGDSLARAEQLAEYWGSGEDVVHFAYLSERYGDIAREHAQLAAGQQQLERLRLERRRLEQALQAGRREGAQEALSAEEQLVNLAATETERGLVVSLGDVLFDSGRAALKPGGERIVLKLYRFLQRNPQRRVRIEGYTDSQGPAGDNLALSQARAQAVADLLGDLGIDAGRIEVRGYGEAFPLAANASSHGRALNRRVEIVFSDEQGKLAAERE